MTPYQYLSLFVVVFASAQIASSDAFYLLCAHTMNAGLKILAAQFKTEDIDPNLCSQITYMSAFVDSEKMTIKPAPYFPDGLDNYRNFTGLKTRNTPMRSLLTIEESVGSNAFEAVSATNDTATEFADKVTIYLRQRNFDGLHIHWKYPTANTKANLMRLVRALNCEFNNRVRLTLAVSGPVVQSAIDSGFNVPELAKYINYVILMTHEYIPDQSRKAEFFSPLYTRANAGLDPNMNINWSVNYWKSLGMPYNKIMITLSGMGTSMVLQNPANYAPGAATTGEWKKGPQYWLRGYTYPELCEGLFNETSARKLFDDEQKTAYLVFGNRWFGYEDARSLEIKVLWAKGLGLYGLCFWTIDNDDFTGRYCGQGANPLLRSLQKYKRLILSSD